MEAINLRKFSEMSCLEMIHFCERRRHIKVIDDDNEEIQTDTLLLSLNWFGLIIHRNFPKEPYSIKEVINLSGEDGYPTFANDKLLNKPINVFIKKILLKYDNPETYDLVKQLIFVFQNLLHNFLCIIGKYHVVSARAVDVKRIYKHPKIQQLKKERLERKLTQEEATIVFDRILLTEEDFNDSVFALLYRTKSLDRIQSYQLIIERGSVFDINNTILPFNIDNSYCEGITNLADSLGDSKGAGFSLVTNGAALQNSEWFHMKIHNFTHVVETVRYGDDCGSTKGMIVPIISKDFREALMGKWYFKEDGTQELIHYDTIENLQIGKVYKIRSVAWCYHSHGGKPCGKCFGRMDTSLPYNIFTKRSAVPGLFFGSTYAETIGQSMLKSKHTIGGAISFSFKPRKEDKKYISSDGDYIFFQDSFLDKEKSPYIILDKLTYLDFADYISMENVDELDPNHLRTYESIQVSMKVPNPMFDGKYGIETNTIETTIGSRKARMTREFISFLKDKRMEEEGRVMKVSLIGWDNTQPAFELPFINEDLDGYRRRVEDSLKFIALKGLIENEVDEVRHGEQVIDLWKTMNDKNKDVNIIVHDILLWSCMCKDPKNLDYSLPVGDDPRVFVSFHDCIINRGQGNALIYGWQSKSLTGSPLNFEVKNRQGGVLESFISPIADL